MSANSVGAVCIHVTVMVPRDAFIDIYIANELLDEHADIVKEKSLTNSILNRKNQQN